MERNLPPSFWASPLTHRCVVEAASGALGCEVLEAVPIGAGGNGRVYRVDTADGRRLALKWYFRDKTDARDRLSAEFGALQFLSANGVTSVPRPVLANRPAGFAVYEYIDGRLASDDEIDAADISAALAFTQQLRRLCSLPETDEFPAASEACFCFRDLKLNLEHRAAQLEQVATDTQAGWALRQFLDDEFRSAMRVTIEESGARLRRAGVAIDGSLAVQCRTLSSSDFGLHNAIRCVRGLIFIDFEYFGWDDPAKLISDFLLHPAMVLSDSLKEQFVHGAITDFEYDSTLPVRVAALYPLFALKWCLILLNEFLPDQLLRRRFAAGALSDLPNLQMRQLGKAKRMLLAAAVPIVV